MPESVHKHVTGVPISAQYVELSHSDKTSNGVILGPK